MSGPGKTAAELELDETDEVETEVDAGADGGDSDADETDGLGDESGEDTEDRSEDDASGGHEGQKGPQAEVKPLSRASQAVVEAKRRAREAEAERDRIRAENAQLRAAQEGRSTAQEAEEERRRLELMDPLERSEYQTKKLETKFGNELQRLQFQQWDSGDKLAFDRMCDRYPAIDAIREDVEEALAGERRQGRNASREAVAKYLLGERALKRAAAAKTRQGKRGAQNIEREKGRPSGGRSEVSRGSEKGGSERARRYERIKDLSI